MNSPLKALLVISLFAAMSFTFFGLTHSEGWSDPTSENRPLAGDAGQYNLYAKNLVLNGFYGSGKVFDNFREPGYPLFLAVIYKIFGLYNFTAVRVCQMILLALTGFLVYLVFRIYQKNKFGLMAGILTVIIPYLGYYSVELTSEILFLFLLVLSFFLFIRIIKEKNSSPGYYIVLGLTFGFAILVRAQLLLFFPLIFVIWLFAKHNPRLNNISANNFVASFIIIIFIIGGWLTYTYSQIGRFSITEGRLGQLVYYRAVRAQLSYSELGCYFTGWLKRSATGGRQSIPCLDNYEFKTLYDKYYEEVSRVGVNSVQDKSIAAITSHFDKYLAGNAIEVVKLDFIEHTYAGSYNKYLRAGFYFFLYLLFLVGLIRFVFFRQKEFRLIAALGLLFIAYNTIIITALDAVPRYNTPYLPFYLVVGLVGVYPLLPKCIKTQK